MKQSRSGARRLKFWKFAFLRPQHDLPEWADQVYTRGKDSARKSDGALSFFRS